MNAEQAIAEIIERASKALGREPSEQNLEDGLLVAGVLHTLSERLGGWPLVVGKDGRIGRLKATSTFLGTDQRLYRVCWETEPCES